MMCKYHDTCKIILCEGDDDCIFRDYRDKEKKMKTSESGLEFIKDEEGVMLHPYRDPANLLTIGVGHLLTTSEKQSGHIIIGR
jgi:hypothetical protein